MSRLEEISQWVIDNRYPKSEQEKISDSNLFHLLNAKIEKYAKEVAIASLKEASLNACIEPNGMMTRVDKETITNPENIVML